MANKIVTNVGRNAIRDELQALVDELAVGTDGTDASTTDTDLGNQVVAKTASTSDEGDGEAQFVIRLDTTDANNTDLRELGAKTGSGDLLSRLVFAEISKTSDFEVEFRLTKTVQNP